MFTCSASASDCFHVRSGSSKWSSTVTDIWFFKLCCELTQLNQLRCHPQKTLPTGKNSNDVCRPGESRYHQLKYHHKFLPIFNFNSIFQNQQLPCNDVCRPGKSRGELLQRLTPLLHLGWSSWLGSSLQTPLHSFGSNTHHLFLPGGCLLSQHCVRELLQRGRDVRHVLATTFAKTSLILHPKSIESNLESNWNPTKIPSFYKHIKH